MIIEEIHTSKMKEIKERFCSMVKSFLKTHVVYKKGMPFDIDFVVRTIWHFVENDYENLLFYQEENAALRAALHRAVVLPCGVGDIVYGIGVTDCDDAHTTDEKQKREIFNDCMKMSGHCEKCKHGHLAITEFVCTHIQIGENGIGNSNILVVGKNYENYTAKNVFTSREAAEAKLKELEGGRKE